MNTSTYYSNNTRTVTLLERNRSQLTEIKIFRDGSQVVPTNVTYTLLKPNGGKLVEAQTGSIDVHGTCSYTLSTSQLSKTLTLGEGYVEDWHITISGNVFRFRRMAAVVLRRLYPVVSQEDLIACYSQLASLLPSNLTSYQKYLDTSWEKILRKIRSQGSGYEYLVCSPESFFDAHLHLTLSLIFYDFHSNLGAETSRFYDLGTQHQQDYVDEWSNVKFVYDESHNLNPDDDNKRVAGQPIIYLNSRGRYRWNFSR